MGKVKYLGIILGIIGLLSCGFTTSAFSDELDDELYKANGFVWSPTDTVAYDRAFTNPKPSFEGVYYCKNSEVREFFWKKILDEKRNIMLEVGLSGWITPSHEKLQKAYEAGQCKPVTEFKVLTKKSYTCEGAFSNGEFLDIAYCKTTPETYKKARAAGKTNDQIEQVFERAEASIVKDFKAGKAK